ncbi:hypothetical protein BGZ51_007915 [Haplosporangium sp. Z 767]|nr:hypothetical protein BGZ50_007976 [Haplosporangium sp. Z 11]KAF9178244.1 hypothetical protein BGZ51_007915 [Haplosporangium sp. Z 767]
MTDTDKKSSEEACNNKSSAAFTSLLSRVPVDIKVKPEKRTVAHAHPYLQGNFYPVFEETVGDEGIECEVIGLIPDCLRGSQYIRTGPNSLHIPNETVAHHFFDGEGMLHGVYFHPGTEGEDENTPIRARYMNRYVRSDVFHKVNKHGRIMLSVGIMMNGGKSVLKVIREAVPMLFKNVYYRLTNIGTGNTALTIVGSRVLALQEAGTPYETRVPSLDTVGEYFFEEEGQKRSKKFLPNSESCTAHPKTDPKTGEVVLINWRILKPFAVYSVITADGKRRVWEEPIPGFTKATMMHDFAITPHYSIVLKLGFALDPIKNIKRKKPVIAFDESVPALFGIIPRYFNHKKDKVLWFETRSCHIFHTCNAWEENDADGNVIAICMTACRSERFPSDINLWPSSGPDNYGGGKTAEEFKKQYVKPGNGDYEHQDPDGTYLTLFRFDLKTMETRITTLATFTSELPVINWAWYMRPESRYVYAAMNSGSTPNTGFKCYGVVKVDVHAVMEKQKELLNAGPLKNVGGDGQWEIGSEALQQVEKQFTRTFEFGDTYCGGEVIFVPRLPRADGKELAEDDGYLLVYVYDESQIENGLVVDAERQVTELWIFDAKTVGQDQGLLCRIKIPRRIPYGFHGIHISRKQIQANKDLLSRCSNPKAL